MNILCVGDIFGKPGRAALRRLLPVLVEQHAIDFTIVNCENAAGGRGVSAKIAEELLPLPVQVYTTGNHVWQHKDLAPYLERERFLRPHNAPADRPGRGVGCFSARNGIPVGVVNLQGRVFMYEGEQYANPFHVAATLVEELRRTTPCIVVDFHAEVTSEKKALGWWLDGKVSAVVGTHTHIQTADAQILPGGTAYITDIGMTGPHASVLGARPADAIKRFLTDGKEKRWEPATDGVRLEGAIVTIDEATGRAVRIERVQKAMENILP